MRREPDFFGDAELSLLYLATRLSKALALEELLTANEVEYLLETNTYTGGFLIKRDLTGVFFYVPHPALDAAQAVLRANGFKPYAGE